MKTNKITFQKFMDIEAHGEYWSNSKLTERAMKDYDYTIYCGDPNVCNDYIYPYMVSESCANKIKEHTDETVIYISDLDLYVLLMDTGTEWTKWYYNFKKPLNVL